MVNQLVVLVEGRGKHVWVQTHRQALFLHPALIINLHFFHEKSVYIIFRKCVLFKMLFVHSLTWYCAC